MCQQRQVTQNILASGHEEGLATQKKKDLGMSHRSLRPQQALKAFMGLSFLNWSRPRGTERRCRDQSPWPYTVMQTSTIYSRIDDGGTLVFGLAWRKDTQTTGSETLSPPPPTTTRLLTPAQPRSHDTPIPHEQKQYFMSDDIDKRDLWTKAKLDDKLGPWFATLCVVV